VGGPFRNSINLLVNLLDVNDRDLLLSLFKQAYVKLETCVFVVHNLRVCAVCKMRCAIWLELGSGLVYGSDRVWVTVRLGQKFLHMHNLEILQIAM